MRKSGRLSNGGNASVEATGWGGGATFRRSGKSGGANRPLSFLPTAAAKCRLCSWNAAAMFQLDPIRGRHKRDALNRLAADHDVILLQEPYGAEADLRVRCPQIADAFHCWCSQADQRAKGGVMTLVRKSWLIAGTLPPAEVIVEGRVLRVEMTGHDSRKLVCWSVHN